ETMKTLPVCLIAVLLLASGCSKKAETKSNKDKENAEAKAVAAIRPAPAPVEPPKPPPEPWVGERVIDPGKIPVEEDCATDAEWRITARTNLEAELDQVEKELVTAIQRGGLAKTSP